MDARQMAAMAEATRLTRQGRLVEATALIQQTLACPGATGRMPDAPSAEEQAGGILSRPPVLPPPADEGTTPRQVPSGWIRRLRASPAAAHRIPAPHTGPRRRPPNDQRPV